MKCVLDLEGQLGAAGDQARSVNRRSPGRVESTTTLVAQMCRRSTDAPPAVTSLKRLEQALTAAKVTHTIDTYPAAHGFAVPDNPEYDTAADERHSTTLADLYASNLDTGPAGSAAPLT